MIGMIQQSTIPTRIDLCCIEDQDKGQRLVRKRSNNDVFWVKERSFHLIIFLLFTPKHGVWKSQKKSHSTLCEASYVYILSGQKLIKKAKNGQFWRVFENLKLAVKQCYQTGFWKKKNNLYTSSRTAFASLLAVKKWLFKKSESKQKKPSLLFHFLFEVMGLVLKDFVVRWAFMGKWSIIFLSGVFYALMSDRSPFLQAVITSVQLCTT